MGIDPNNNDQNNISDDPHGSPAEQASSTPAPTPAPLKGVGGGRWGLDTGAGDRPAGAAGRRSGGAGGGDEDDVHLGLLASEIDNLDPDLDDDLAQLDEIEQARLDAMTPEEAAELAKIQEINDRVAGGGTVSLADLWNCDLDYLPGSPTPDIGFIADGLAGIMYSGKSNGIAAEPGVGKTTLALKMLAQAAEAGRWSIFLDREKDVWDFARRMKTFNCPPEVAHMIRYFKPKYSLALLAPAVAQLMRRAKIDILLLDTVSRDMTAGGFEENNNDHARRWYTEAIEPLLAAGRTVICIDHLSKPGLNNGKPVAYAGRSARGASSKLDVITGTQVIVEVKEEFSKVKAGSVRLRASKDNSGTYAMNQVIAEAHITPQGDGTSEITFRKPADTDTTGRWRPTSYMEKVSRYLEGLPDDDVDNRTKTKIAAGAGIKEKYAAVAIERLIAEEYATLTIGKRNAHQIWLTKPFRDDGTCVLQTEGDEQPNVVERLEEQFDLPSDDEILAELARQFEEHTDNPFDDLDGPSLWDGEPI